MPSTTSRRALLAGVCSVTTALAGCSFGSDGSAGNGGPTNRTNAHSPTETRQVVRTKTGETVAVDGTDVTVSFPRVRSAVVCDSVHGRICQPPGQFLVCRFDIGSSAGGDDGRYSSALESNIAQFGVALDDEFVDVTEVRQLEFDTSVAVPVPVTEASRAAVRWDGTDRTVEWELGPEVRRNLVRLPRFSVESKDVTLAEGDRSAELSVSVTNSGERAGTWLAWYSTKGFSGRSFVRLPVPVGETRSRTVRIHNVRSTDDVQIVHM